MHLGRNCHHYPSLQTIKNQTSISPISILISTCIIFPIRIGTRPLAIPSQTTNGHSLQEFLYWLVRGHQISREEADIGREVSIVLEGVVDGTR